MCVFRLYSYHLDGAASVMGMFWYIAILCDTVNYDYINALSITIFMYLLCFLECVAIDCIKSILPTFIMYS